jgi:NitT/TauT family transport system substrate-binding protein
MENPCERRPAVADSALVQSYLQGLAPGILGGIDDKPAEIEANGGKTPTTASTSSGSSS